LIEILNRRFCGYNISAGRLFCGCFLFLRLNLLFAVNNKQKIVLEANMRRKPMKVFTAAVFIISLLLLALCFYKEQEPKSAGGFYCFTASLGKDEMY
jgi:hypothetical protein